MQITNSKAIILEYLSVVIVCCAVCVFLDKVVAPLNEYK